MSDGEGSPVDNILINSFNEDPKTTEYLNSDKHMTIMGDGTRRRKVIRAAKETLDKASRLLRTKVPCAGILMTPRRLWIQKVPTQECDVVIMFPSGTSDEILTWLLRRLRTGTLGLIVHIRHHASTDCYGFYLTAPFSILLKAAEEIHLPMSLRQEFGGGLKEFISSEAGYFERSDNESHFFTSQERQSLLLHILQSLRFSQEDDYSLPGLKLVDGQAIISKCLSSGLILQVYPLHEIPALEKLQKTWVQAFMSSQPLDDICKYFGVKITMYFAWLGHYTTALIIPAAVGVIYWVGIIGRNQAVEDVAYVIFSVFNVIWATVYLEAWKRRGAELAYRWGTLDQRDDLLLEPRSLFRGTLVISPVTGRLEPTYPEWRRNVFRYCISVPIIAVFLFIVFIVMFLSFRIQDWWDAQLGTSGYYFGLSYVPKVLLAVVIALMDEIYFKVAVWLNDLENYRLDSKYENHLIYKVAMFQFVNSFLSLFYLAFYIQDQERLKEQLAALLITRQIIGNLKESAVPYVIEQIRLARMSFVLFGDLSPTDTKHSLIENAEEQNPMFRNEEVGEGDSKEFEKGKQPRNVCQAELESSLYQYDGAFSEHLEMLSQLGYVCLFSSAFPLAALAALLGNILELRVDAFKLCFILQRPFGQRVSNIGTWQNAMEAISLIAILVNCGLISLSGQVQRMFPEMSATQTILLIVALEHVMLAIRFIIIVAVPDIPSWVATEMAKVEFLRREAVRKFSSTASPEQKLPTVIGRFVVNAASENYEQQTHIDFFEKEEVKTTFETRKISPNRQEAINLSLGGSRISDIANTSFSAIPANSDYGQCNKMFRDIQNSPRCSPSGAEEGRRSSEWGKRESQSFCNEEGFVHHVTIGPHGSRDWIRKLGLESTGRKCSDSEINETKSRRDNEEELLLHKSTDCIALKDFATSSDTDLIRLRFSRNNDKRNDTSKKSKQLYFQQENVSHRQSKELNEPLRFCPEEKDTDYNKLMSSQEEEKSSKEDKEAKKTRIKQSLMKRARSVAIFSLKLKERRAREAEVKAREIGKAAKWNQPESSGIGGELSCIPIEKLISVDDIASMEIRRANQ